jgi:hypothetical protein
MSMPYRARINERLLLNLPGFHGGAFVYGYVEDTSERSTPLRRCRSCGDDCTKCPRNFEPRMILEIADCDQRISLQFDVDSIEGRDNSLHKLDTLLAAVRLFREAFIAEFEPYDQRMRAFQLLQQ